MDVVVCQVQSLIQWPARRLPPPAPHISCTTQAGVQGSKSWVGMHVSRVMIMYYEWRCTKMTQLCYKGQYFSPVKVLKMYTQDKTGLTNLASNFYIWSLLFGWWWRMNSGHLIGSIYIIYNLPSSQSCPVHPAVHVHVYELSPSTHWPPW